MFGDVLLRSGCVLVRTVARLSPWGGGGGCSFLLSASDFVEMRGKVGSSRLLFVRSGGSASSSTISMMCEVAHCSM